MKECIKSELNSQKGYVVMLYKITSIVCIKYLTALIPKVVNNCTSIDIIINKIDFVSEQQRMIIQIDICEKEDNSKKARIRYISEDITIHINSLNVQSIEGFLGDKYYSNNMYIFIHKNSQTFNTFLNKRNTIISGVNLGSYANNNGWESIRHLFVHIGIGLKIFDEAHLNFDNISRIDSCWIVYDLMS